MPSHRFINWPWLTLQIIAANVAITVAVVSLWYIAFVNQSSVYYERLMTTFNIEPGSLHAMYVDDVERHLWMNLSFGLVFAILASVGLALLIVKPIRSLAKATEELKYGNYNIRSEIKAGEVGQLAGTFNSLAASLEREERRRSQFLADLSHEIRTPITSLQGYTEGLEDGVFQANKNYFSLMESELKHLSALTTTIQTMQLNAFENIDNDQESDLSLSGHIQSAKTRWLPRFQQRELDLEVDELDSLLSSDLAISTQSFRQIIDNLLSNMYRYAKSSSICNIEISDAAHSGQLKLAFSNDTVDVSKGSVPYLFDRFYRVSKSRTRTQNEHSMGLGLSIVRQLCHQHKGNVTAKLENERLTISVFLPVRV